MPRIICYEPSSEYYPSIDAIGIAGSAVPLYEMHLVFVDLIEAPERNLKV